jgi:uncharacterized protein YeaO (DUF488 family)
MSLHTLDDGITPDPTITTDMYDRWCPVLAPPQTLVGAHYKRDLPWDQFEASYYDYLAGEEVQPAVIELGETALQQNVSILCTEPSPEQCHRRLLAIRAQLLVPELEINLQ